MTRFVSVDDDNNLPADVLAALPAGGGFDGGLPMLFESHVTNSPNSAFPIDKEYRFPTWEAVDDAPSVPRPELMIVSPDDSTQISVVQRGRYLLNFEADILIGSTDGLSVPDGTWVEPVLIDGNIGISVNNEGSAPAYYVYPQYWHILDPTHNRHATLASVSISIEQPLAAGDLLSTIYYWRARPVAPIDSTDIEIGNLGLFSPGYLSVTYLGEWPA